MPKKTKKQSSSESDSDEESKTSNGDVDYSSSEQHSGSSSSDDSAAARKAKKKMEAKQVETPDEEDKPPELSFGLTTLKQIFQFTKQHITQTKQRVDMTRLEMNGGEDPRVRTRRQKLVDRIRMQPHIKLLIIDMVNFNLSLLTEKDRRSLIGDLSEQQRVLDAKKAEELEPPVEKKKGGKKGAKPKVDESQIIETYMQKKDDLEFRTLQELNKQMTNWVETLQSQSFGNPSDVAAEHYQDVIFSEDEDYQSQHELGSEFLSDNPSDLDFETLRPKRKQPSLPKVDARDAKEDNFGSKRGGRHSRSPSITEGSEDDEDSLDGRPDLASAQVQLESPHLGGIGGRNLPPESALRQFSDKRQIVERDQRHERKQKRKHKRQVEQVDPVEKAMLDERQNLQRNADALMAQLSASRAAPTDSDARAFTEFDDTMSKAVSKRTKQGKVAQNRYNPILQTMQSEHLSSREGGHNQATAHLFTSNPYHPQAPLKQSIDHLRGQIQALQKLQSFHAQDPLTVGRGNPAGHLAPISQQMSHSPLPFPDPAAKMTAKMMSDMTGGFGASHLPDPMRMEHAAQNMATVYDQVAADHQKATQSQFKVFHFCHQIKSGNFDYDMVSNAKRQHILPNIKDAEFLALSPQGSAVIVKHSDRHVDVLDGDTLDRAFDMKCDLTKCILLSQKLIFVGTWNNQVQVYDVSQDFALIKSLKTKAGVRALSHVGGDLIIAGEHDGFIDLISVDTLQIVVSKRFESVGAIYQIQPTTLRDEIVICSYTGVHFVKIFREQTTATMSLHLNPVSYMTEQFVNKVIEYEPGRYVAAVWDSGKFIMIDHEQEKMGKVIAHPQAAKTQARCWGMAKMPGYDYQKMPFVMARDNTGIVLIDVRNRVAYMFAHAPIKANLFGHGDILKIVQADLPLPGGGKTKVAQLWTVMQYSESAQQAAVVCVQLPADLNLALETLVKID